MKDLEYDEFEVVLERSGGGFSARVAESPTGTAPPMPFVPPLDTAELPALRLTMRGAAEAGVAAEPVPGAVGPKDFGKSLFRALFNEKAENILRTSQFVAAKSGHGLRLRIRFADVAELANLPWELLYDPDKHKYPCQYRTFPTIRTLDLPDPEAPIKVSGALRMLVVISGPKDLPELDVEKEWMHLRDELAPLVEAGRVELVRLEPPTLEALRAKVLAQEFHVFHFVGHGGIDPDGEGYLAFVKPNGLQHDVPGSQLGVMLSNSPIRLAVLNSCQGGTVSAVDPYGSAAIALVEAGIPAVIAMQFPISDDAAQTFSRTLYDSVAAGRSVDLAVTLGRQAVLATSDSEWATPVLYLRARDGFLFELKDGPVATILEDPTEAPPSGPVPVSSAPVSTAPVSAAPVSAAPVSAAPVSAAPVSAGSLPFAAQSPPLASPVPSPPTHPRDGGVAEGSVDPIVRDRVARAEPTGTAATHPSTPTAVLTPPPRRAAPPRTPVARPAPTLAGGSGGERPDAPIVVKARHVRRLPIVILLVLALAAVVWWAMRPQATVPAAPTHVVASVSSAGRVSMSWDPAPDGTAVARWEVYDGDQRVATATQPSVSFQAARVGEVTYRVIAVAPDGGQSAATAADPVTVPTPETPPPKEPPTTPEPAPAPTTADIEITVLRSESITREEERVVFETDNLGKAQVVEEEVFVEAVGGGQIYAAEFRFQDGEAQACAVDGPRASCALGKQPLKGVFHIEVTVGWGPSSTGLQATVKDIGGTTDPSMHDNSVIYPHVASGEPDTSPPPDSSPQPS